MSSSPVHPSSFRDPSGQVYLHEGELYRRVDPSYAEHYDLLLESGLYDEVVEDGLLVDHEEAPPGTPCPAEAYKVLRPRRVPFVSHPFEWCFGQLRDAALLARGPAGATLALALVHHLAIGHNVPLGRIADLLAELAPVSVVEWVPKADPMVERLLASREDVFPAYTEAGFEAAFGRRFTVEAKEPLPGSGRVLYRFRRREAGEPA